MKRVSEPQIIEREDERQEIEERERFIINSIDEAVWEKLINPENKKEERIIH